MCNFLFFFIHMFLNKPLFTGCISYSAVTGIGERMKIVCLNQVQPMTYILVYVIKVGSCTS